MWYTIECTTSHLYMYYLGIHMSLSHKSMLQNYFITCHRKYSSQHNQCNISLAHDGKGGFNIVEYIAAFLYSDWLYFLWLYIKIQLQNCMNSRLLYSKMGIYAGISSCASKILVFPVWYVLFCSTVTKLLCQTKVDNVELSLYKQ